MRVGLRVAVLVVSVALVQGVPAPTRRPSRPTKRPRPYQPRPKNRNNKAATDEDGLKELEIGAATMALSFHIGS